MLVPLAATQPSAHAQTCDPGVLGPDAEILTSKGYTLAFRPDPSPIALAIPFSIDVFICPETGTAPVESLRASVIMPDQKQNSSAAPSVASRGNGHFRVNGYMLQTPGRWELSFEVQAGATSAKFATEIVLP